jgi:RNA polymerase sigma-70 factor (ECF subfamily)
MKLDMASPHHNTVSRQRFLRTAPRQPPTDLSPSAETVRPVDLRDFRTQLLDHLPRLRGFARGLTGERSRSDDLVQDALMRALAGEHRYEPGTNLRAWLFTILRNCHLNEYRRQRFYGGTLEDLPEARLSIRGNQQAVVELKQVNRLILTMPVKLRTALNLVSAAELTYKDASVVCGCAVGTVKSRVNRARTELVRMIEKSTIHTSDGVPMRHGAHPAA